MEISARDPIVENVQQGPGPVANVLSIVSVGQQLLDTGLFQQLANDASGMI